MARIGPIPAPSGLINGSQGHELQGIVQAGIVFAEPIGHARLKQVALALISPFCDCTTDWLGSQAELDQDRAEYQHRR